MTQATLSSHRILFRVDGHHKFGLGHIYRCLGLALAAREHLGIEPVFLMLRSSLTENTAEIFARHGLPVKIVSGDNPYLEDFSRTERMIQQEHADAIVTDLLTPDPTDRDLLDDADLSFPSVPKYIEALKSLCRPVVAITDEPDRIDIRPDVVIDHSCHRQPEDFADAVGTLFCLGTENYPLGSDFAPFVERNRPFREAVEQVLVIFGGTDHNKFTLRTARMLARTTNANVRVVLGPAVAERQETKAELVSLGAEVIENAPSVAGLMFEADLAVTAGGNTCFELAAMGTPAITLCTRLRQVRNADYFQSRGTLLNLGLGELVSNAEIGDAVALLTREVTNRNRMSAAGRSLVDGRGLERVLKVLSDMTAERKRLWA